VREERTKPLDYLVLSNFGKKVGQMEEGRGKREEGREEERRTIALLRGTFSTNWQLDSVILKNL
jgi:hypothetical protein